MLFSWRPWEPQAGKKTLTVTGRAVLEEAPDQYVFSPTFSAESDTAAQAVSLVSLKGNEVIAALKELGIAEDQITTRIEGSNYTSDGSDQPYPIAPRREGEQFMAYYHITCRVKDRPLAQKVTDYLASSGATGGITPQADFALETRARLDAEIRQKAIQDARAKAQTEADELGIKLGEVVSVSEDPSSGGVLPPGSKVDATVRNPNTPPVLSGRQQISLLLTVTYSIR